MAAKMKPTCPWEAIPGPLGLAPPWRQKRDLLAYHRFSHTVHLAAQAGVRQPCGSPSSQVERF